MSGSQSQGGGEDTLASAVLLLIQAQAKQADAAEKAANQRAELLKVQKDEAKRKADGAAAKEGDRLAAAAQVTEDADVKLRKRLRDTLSERCVRADAVAAVAALAAALARTPGRKVVKLAKLFALLGGPDSALSAAFRSQWGEANSTDSEREQLILADLSDDASAFIDNAELWRAKLLKSARVPPPAPNAWPEPNSSESLANYVERAAVVPRARDLASYLVEPIAKARSDAMKRRNFTAKSINNEIAEAVAARLLSMHIETHVVADAAHATARRELESVTSVGELNQVTLTDHRDVKLQQRARGVRRQKKSEPGSNLSSYTVRLPSATAALRARVPLRATPLAADGAASDDGAIEHAALADLGGSAALVRADLVAGAARVDAAGLPPITHLELADGSRSALSEPVRPVQLRVEADGLKTTVVHAYPLPNLVEPLMLGDRTLSELGGATVVVPSDPSGAVSIALHNATGPSARDGSMTDTGGDTADGSATDAPDACRPTPATVAMHRVTLVFDEGEVVLDGEDLVTRDAHSGELSANVSPAQCEAAHAALRARCRDAADAAQRELQTAAAANVWRPVTQSAAAANLFMPDMSQPGYVPGVDAAPVEPLESDARPAYRYASGQDKLCALIDENVHMTTSQKERFKRGVRAIDGLTLTSSDAPPVPYGPVSGEGSVHRIVLKPNADVNDAYSKRRHFPWKHRAAMDKSKAAWDEFAIVQETPAGDTRVVSQPVVAPKYDADHRITGYRVAVDFRKVNDLTIKDRYAPPLLSDVLEFVAEGEYINVWDAKALFHQFRLHPESQPLTNTQWHDGSHFVWLRAPFGLASILPTAQRWADRHLATEDRMVYVDDGFDRGRSVDHAIDVGLDFLRRCAAHNLAIGVDKTQICTPTPVALGHDVDCAASTYAPHASRIAAMATYRRPTTNKGLKRFISKGAYWGRFVPGWSAMQRSLSSFINYNRPLVWTEDRIATFLEARMLFTQTIALSVFDERKPLRLYADGCLAGLGYVGAQIADDGSERPVFCGGRATASFERRLHCNELEMLAFRDALQKFPHFLIGTPGGTVLVTDSASTAKFRDRKVKMQSDAVNRFLIELQHGDLRDIKVELIRSSQNWSDADSRQFEEPDPDGRPELKDMLRRALATAEARFAKRSEQALVQPASAAAHTHGEVGADAPQDGEAADAQAGAAEQEYAPAPLTPSLIDPDDAPVLPEPEPADDASGKALAGAEDDDEPAPEPQESDEAVEQAALRAEQHIIASGGYPVLQRERMRVAHETAADGSTWTRDLALAADGKTAPSRAWRLHPARDAIGRLVVRPGGPTTRPLLYLPPSMQMTWIARAHAAPADGGGHRGVASTVSRLSERVWFPNMPKAVKKYIDKCACGQFRDGPPDGFLGTDKELPGAFQHVHVDVIEVEKSVTQGAQPLLVVIDRATSALEIEPLLTKQAAEVTSAFQRCWILRYGVPKRVTVDNDKPMVGDAMHALTAEHGIELDRIADRNAQANGMVERAIKTLKATLRAYTPPVTRADEDSDWRSHLAEARWSFWTAVSQTRGSSPFELTFGQVPVLMLDRALETPVADDPTARAAAKEGELYSDYLARLDAEKKERLQQARDKANRGRARRHAYDKQRQRDKASKAGGVGEFRVGDIVWLRNTQGEFRTKFKNKIRRSGPYEVMQVDAKRNRYKLKDWRTQLAKSGWVSIHRLSPCEARVFQLGRRQEERTPAESAGGRASQSARDGDDEKRGPSANEQVVGTLDIEYVDGEQRRRVLDFRQSVEGPVALVQQQTASGEWSPVFQVLLNTLPAQLVLDIQKRKRRGRWNRRRTARSSGGGSRGGAQSPTQQQQRA